MIAVDFLLYSLGLGVVMISGAFAFRMIATVRGQRGQEATNKSTTTSPRSDIAKIDATDAGLAERLHAFQTQRYSSPIVRRQLGPDAGPRLPPVPTPPQARSVPLPPRQPVNIAGTNKPQPVQRQVPEKAPHKDNVIQLPLKMKPDNKNDKE